METISILEIKNLIKENPNDYDLGQQIRKLVREIEIKNKK